MAKMDRNELTIEEKAELKAKRLARIRTEKTRLRRMLTKHGIDAEILRGVDRVIDRAAFYVVSLADLEDEINADGCTDRYKNGEHQWGTKQSPAVQTHSNFAQRYLTTMKQLLDLLPAGSDKPKEGDELLGYINSR